MKWRFGKVLLKVTFLSLIEFIISDPELFSDRSPSDNVLNALGIASKSSADVVIVGNSFDFALSFNWI